MTNYELIRRLTKEGALSSYPTTEDNVLLVSNAEAWETWLKITFDEHEEVVDIERMPE